MHDISSFKYKLNLVPYILQMYIVLLQFKFKNDPFQAITVGRSWHMSATSMFFIVKNKLRMPWHYILKN